MACLRVYIQSRKKLPGKEIWLIIRKDEVDNETKYQFSNFQMHLPIQALSDWVRSCGRYWMERALQDAKGTAKMADYQLRDWTDTIIW